jgi:hypothetical protein
MNRSINAMKCALWVAVAVAVGPVAEIVVTELVAEQRDNAILRDPLGLPEIAHGRPDWSMPRVREAGAALVLLAKGRTGVAD